MAKGRIEVDEVICKGCELCTMVCPKDLIQMAMDRFTPKGYHPAELIDPAGECTGCAICSVICPEAAITVYRLVPAGTSTMKTESSGGA
jgi:2-oxoglutarate ferredoxin oxidoreductase subunit delta